MLRNKKAALTKTLSIIIELIVVILLVSTALIVAADYDNSNAITKTNAAEEISIMVNTLAGLPGDALIEYPVDVQPFTFSLSQHRITVINTDRSEEMQAIEEFFLPPGFQAAGFVENAQRFCLEKIQKTIQLKACPLDITSSPTTETESTTLT